MGRAAPASRFKNCYIVDGDTAPPQTSKRSTPSAITSEPAAPSGVQDNVGIAQVPALAEGCLVGGPGGVLDAAELVGDDHGANHDRRVGRERPVVRPDQRQASASARSSHSCTWASRAGLLVND
jgi:hypothetical protein